MPVSAALPLGTAAPASRGLSLLKALISRAFNTQESSREYFTEAMARRDHELAQYKAGIKVHTRPHILHSHATCSSLAPPRLARSSLARSTQLSWAMRLIWQAVEHRYLTLENNSAEAINKAAASDETIANLQSALSTLQKAHAGAMEKLNKLMHSTAC